MPPYKTLPIESYIVYATSINPYDRLEEQTRAIKTWDEGHIISFNTRKEIDLLHHTIKGITFVEVPESMTINGKYIKLDAILNGLKNIKAERYILINSDIGISEKIDWTQHDAVIGVRHDDGSKRFIWGYDVFSLTRPMLDIIPTSKYAIGVPWWDFYVPLCIMRAGYKISAVKNKPLFTHEWHETRYNDQLWNEYGRYSFTLPPFPRQGRTIPEFCTATKQFIENNLNVIM